MRVLGIDPGLGGALALLDSDLDLLVCVDMPVIKGARNGRIPEHLLADIIRRLDPEQVWIEEVHSMPKQGVASTFTFGLGFGLVRGVCAGLGLPVRMVSPQAWKPRFQLRREKGASRGVAMRIFPANLSDFRRVKDDGRAEAALIALFGLEHKR